MVTKTPETKEHDLKIPGLMDEAKGAFFSCGERGNSKPISRYERPNITFMICQNSHLNLPQLYRTISHKTFSAL
jgi:hypothetical protein